MTYAKQLDIPILINSMSIIEMEGLKNSLVNGINI